MLTLAVIWLLGAYATLAATLAFDKWHGRADDSDVACLWIAGLWPLTVPLLLVPLAIHALIVGRDGAK